MDELSLHEQIHLKKNSKWTSNDLTDLSQEVHVMGKH